MMRLIRMLFGTVLAVAVPLMAYVITSYAIAITGFYFGEPPYPAIVVPSVIATAVVFWVMTTARANALSLSRVQVAAHRIVSLIFLIPAVIMLSLKWKS